MIHYVLETERSLISLAEEVYKDAREHADECLYFCLAASTLW